MKRFLIVALILLISSFSIGADSIRTPRGFAGKLWKGTFALYGTKNNVTHFLCTAESVSRSKTGYTLLSAGHCVTHVPSDVEFSVSEEIGGLRADVTVLKAYEGDGDDPVDFALFDFPTSKKYTVMEIGTDDDLQIGDHVINPNFGLGLGKQLSRGIISSAILVPSEECAENGCLQNFLVQEYDGPGASGSPVISVRTHKIIGIVVYQFDGQVGFAVEPISRLVELTGAKGLYRQ